MILDDSLAHAIETEPAPNQPDRVAAAVQIVLALYLLPVLCLVAAIGLTSIALGALGRGLARLVPGIGRSARVGSARNPRRIGVRPIALKNPGRSRVAR
jgi:hypothetical protein